MRMRRISVSKEILFISGLEQKYASAPIRPLVEILKNGDLLVGSFPAKRIKDFGYAESPSDKK